MTHQRAVRHPPLESDLDDDQSRNLLDSPLYLQEREVVTGHQCVTLSEKIQCPVHLISVKVQGTPVALFSCKSKSSQEAVSDRKIFLQNINKFWETTNRNLDSLIRKFLSHHSLRNMEIICLRKQNLKSGSKNVKLILLTLASEMSMKWKKLKRAQEMRIDEFSIRKLRESHAAIQEHTSQI